MRESAELISVGQGAEILGWKYHRLMNWIKKGKVPKSDTRKIGWGWAIRRAAIDRIKRDQEAAAKKE